MNKKTWTDILHDTGWGTHQCCFYRKPEEFLRVVIPYLRNGLLHHQHCLWIIPDSFDSMQALAALQAAKLDRYLEQGRIDIIPFTEWYLEHCAPAGQHIFARLSVELDRALVSGAKGLRIATDISGCPPEHWPILQAYEAHADAFMAEKRIVALCTAQVDTFPAEETLTRIQRHQRAIVYRQGGCEFIESSQSRRTREALERERDVSATIVDMVDALIIVLDRDGRIVYFNPACEKITGLNFAEVFEQSPLDHIVPLGDTAAEKAAFKQMWTSHAPGKFEGHVVNCFRERHLIAWSTTVERDVTGEVEYVIYTGMDITQTRQLEEMLEGLIQKWRDTLDALADGVALLDPEGRILRCNKAMAAYLGKTFPDIIGHTFHELLPAHPTAGAQCPFRLAQQDRASASLMYEYYERWYLSRIDPRLDDAGKFLGAVQIITDVTSRKHAEDEILKYQEQLRTLTG